ncbi:hypothetical protein ECANGB1_1587 [Enterospora canceri]|uniref:Uncharacterized protein n=1 Tax=Enterospora canceri TaxID=1081671 RepID=A0A1Y1S3X4_9MICR|nr:hypothetical protein ECANGB1_1587 [Enterospora canceri]
MDAIKDTIVELGPKCKLTPEERQYRLQKNLEKYPEYLDISTNKFPNKVVTIYHYMEFEIRKANLKSPIIKCTSTDNKIMIHDLEEYERNAKKTTKEKVHEKAYEISDEDKKILMRYKILMGVFLTSTVILMLLIGGIAVLKKRKSKKKKGMKILLVDAAGNDEDGTETTYKDIKV